MSFRIEMDEVKTAEETLKRSATSVGQVLAEASEALEVIASSDAIAGEVGKAIGASINNSHKAILIALNDCYVSLKQAYASLISDFKSTVEENSDDAVIDTDVIDDFKRRLSEFRQTKGDHDSGFKIIYNRIDDLVSVQMPPDHFGEKYSDAVKDLDDLQDKVGQFAQVATDAELQTFIDDILRQIGRLKNVAGLSFTDPKSLAVFGDTSFADGINQYHQDLEQRQKELLQEAAVRWKKQHPLRSAEDQQAWEEEFKQFLDDVWNDIWSQDWALFTAGTIIDLKEDSIKELLARGGMNPKSSWGKVVRKVPVASLIVDTVLQVHEGEEARHAVNKAAIHAGTGAVIGAAIGSIIPGPGTVFGFITGMVIGAVVSIPVDAAIDNIYDDLFKEKEDVGQIKDDLKQKTQELNEGFVKKFGRAGTN